MPMPPAKPDMVRTKENSKGSNVEYIHQVIEEAKELPITHRIDAGNFDGIELTQVRQLFKILDRNGDGQLDLEELTTFLKLAMDPPCPPDALEQLQKLFKESSDGKLRPDYFHSFLTMGPLRRLLHDEDRKNLSRTRTQLAEEKAHLVESVPLSYMVSRLQWRTSRDEAFRTLPFIIVYFLIFLTLVITHLRWFDRQMLERAMEEHTAGWGYKYIGPYLHDHLPNLDNTWLWLESSGLQFAFGYCAKDADKSVRPPYCEIAPKNMLISDIMIRQTRLDDDVKQEWLLHMPVAKVKLNTTTIPATDLRYEASLLAAKELRDARWADANTLTFEVVFTTYNEEARMFAVTELLVRTDYYGYQTTSTYSWAIPAEAYPALWVFAPDLVYIVLLIIPLKGEVLEVIAAARGGGWPGFKAYWGFWNVVDWFMIINGCVLVQLWIQLCLAIEIDSVQSLLEFPDWTLKTSVGDTSFLSTAQLDTIYDDLLQTRFLYRAFHMFMAFNTVAIMMKFAKSFKANARLQVVQETLRIAISDVSHFMVVFFTVFIGYAVVGHVLFGGDMRHFNSFGASFNTAFLCLLGDFGWYSDLTMEVEPLGSKLPYTTFAIWFWSFEIFTVLVMMNMLLTIVMDNYGIITSDLARQPDAPSIMTQTRRYIARSKKFKAGKWISLDKILEMLEDEKSPAITGDAAAPVTCDSLLKAFPDMKEEQAHFLMMWLIKDQKASSKSNEADALTQGVAGLEKFISSVTDNMHVIHLAVSRLGVRIQTLENCTIPSDLGQVAAEPAYETTPEVSQQITSQLEEMRELCAQFARQQQFTDKLSAQLEGLTRMSSAPQPQQASW